jgi:hypothetical protein
MYRMRPQGVSRTTSHWRGVQISGVRFWNFTASQPASAAPSISRFATSRLPLWLMTQAGRRRSGDPARQERERARQQWSSTAFVGLALGKEVRSYWPTDELRRLMPSLQVREAAAAQLVTGDRRLRDAEATQHLDEAVAVEGSEPGVPAAELARDGVRLRRLVQRAGDEEDPRRALHGDHRSAAAARDGGAAVKRR